MGATVLAIAQAVDALFVFLATPEGQATVKQWREDSKEWNAAVAKAGAWVEGILK